MSMTHIRSMIRVVPALACACGVALLVSSAAVAGRGDARQRIQVEIEAKGARLRGGAGAAASPAPLSIQGASGARDTPLVVTVDCDRKGSLGEAVARKDVRPLVIQVSGTCRESVRIEQPGITIAGVAPGAVIQRPSVGAQPIGPVLFARGAHGLTVHDLTVR